MARSEDMQDLAKYFYAVGKKAAKPATINDDLVIYQKCAASPSVDISKEPTLPNGIAHKRTNNSSVYRNTDVMTRTFSKLAVKLRPTEQISCQLQSKLPLNDETTTKQLFAQAAPCNPPKTIGVLSQEPTERGNDETRTKIPFDKAASCSPLKSVEPLPGINPVSRSLCDESTPNTPIPQVASCDNPKSIDTLPPVPGSCFSDDGSTAFKGHTPEAQVWLNLTDGLEIFFSDAYSVLETSDHQQIQDNLDIRLTEALETISAKEVSCQTLNIPFDNLIKVCDVTSSVVTSVWNSSLAAIEAANSILPDKTLKAMCNFSGRGQIPSDALQKSLNFENRMILVHFGDCETNGEMDDVEANLLATGAYIRDAQTLRNAEMHIGNTSIAFGRVPENVTCIRVQDACHFWAYVGTEWRQRLQELNAIYVDCDVSDDELMGEDGGEMYLTKQPKKNDVLLMVVEDGSFAEFGFSAVRVRVIDVLQNKALLWCPDFATFSVREWRVLRHCHKKMMRIPFQAELCQIAGLVAKPPIKIVRKCCALLLTLLTRWTFTHDDISISVNDITLSNLFKVFLPLCSGPLEALRRPALWCVCIGATLPGCEKQSSTKFEDLVAHYVEYIRKTSSIDVICGDLEEELITLTQTIRNLLFNFVELRKYFAEIGGFPVVIQLSRSLDGDLEIEIWKLLRVLFGAGDLFKESTSQNPTVKVGGKISPPEAVPERPPTKGRNPILPKKSIKYLLQEWMLASMAEKEAEENGVAKEVPALSMNSKASSHATYRVNTKNREYLIRGKVFPIPPSDATIMMPQRKVNEIVHMNVIQAVCGLLNSDTGGAIYFGIGQHNVVEGINVVRKQRDDIRTGFDTYFDNYLNPRIGPIACNLAYIKVFEPNEPKDVGRAQHTLHVIRVEVKVSSSALFKIKSGEYFVIKNGAPVAATTQELREKIIRSTEKQFT